MSAPAWFTRALIIQTLQSGKSQPYQQPAAELDQLISQYKVDA